MLDLTDFGRFARFDLILRLEILQLIRISLLFRIRINVRRH